MVTCYSAVSFLVSIHAPREGCDISGLSRGIGRDAFQFTHPGRGATGDSLAPRDLLHVSIHAPREGCDTPLLLKYSDRSEVSIHAPREGCDVKFKEVTHLIHEFQFTHPGRGATGR